MSFNSKQNSLCQLAATELYPKETKKSVSPNNKKQQKRVWVWWLVVLSLSKHADHNFLVWWSLIAQAEGFFQDSKELKRNERVAMFQDRLS